MFDRFEKIVVVNLPSRTDRRRETERELSRFGKVEATFFPAFRMEDKGKFGSIGEHGCYLSHLAVLKDAQGSKNVLVLEDDVSFVPDLAARAAMLDRLPADWDVFYGGHDHLPGKAVQWPGDGLVPVAGSVEFVGAHCYAVNGPALARLIARLEVYLGRERGDPDGGPMPFDGALNRARAKLDLKTFAAVPSLAGQRSSRTDIADLRWFDRTPGVRELASYARRVKTRLGR
jgi:hypothetical protein